MASRHYVRPRATTAALPAYQPNRSNVTILKFVIFTRNRWDAVLILKLSDGRIISVFRNINKVTHLHYEYALYVPATITYHGALYLEPSGSGYRLWLKKFPDTNLVMAEECLSDRHTFPADLAEFLTSNVKHIEPFYGGFKISGLDGRACFICTTSKQVVVGRFIVRPEMADCLAFVDTSQSLILAQARHNELWIYRATTGELVGQHPYMVANQRIVFSNAIELIDAIHRGDSNDNARIRIRILGKPGTFAVAVSIASEDYAPPLQIIDCGQGIGFPGLVYCNGGYVFYNIPEDCNTNLVDPVAVHTSKLQYSMPALYSIDKPNLCAVIYQDQKCPRLNSNTQVERFEIRVDEIRATVLIVKHDRAKLGNIKYIYVPEAGFANNVRVPNDMLPHFAWPAVRPTVKPLVHLPVRPQVQPASVFIAPPPNVLIAIEDHNTASTWSVPQAEQAEEWPSLPLGVTPLNRPSAAPSWPNKPIRPIPVTPQCIAPLPALPPLSQAEHAQYCEFIIRSSLDQRKHSAYLSDGQWFLYQTPNVLILC